MVSDFHTIAETAAGRGLNTMLEGFALAAVSWAALRCFGARSSLTRFAVWFSTLLVIAALPWIKLSESQNIVSSSHLPQVTLSRAWAAGLFVAWALIALTFLLRIALSLRHVYQLRRSCKEIDPSSYPTLMEIAKQFSRRRLILASSDRVSIPTALGFFNPAVVIPAWALRELSPDELRVIVLHELAHLKRRDDWTNLAQKVVKALFFFHPAVWWIDSRLEIERENACDDIVLEQTSSARAYAASLVSVAEKVVAERERLRRALALAQSAVGRVHEVSARVARILDGRSRSNRGWRPALAMVGTLALIAVAGMPYAPELVAVQQNARPVISAEGRGIKSVSVIPASLKWSGASDALIRTASNPAARWTGADARRPTSQIAKEPVVIPAKATIRPKDHKPRVMMAKANSRKRPAATLLVLRSRRADGSDVRAWTLSVWRVTSPDGRTVQEMIVMNSI